MSERQDSGAERYSYDLQRAREAPGSADAHHSGPDDDVISMIAAFVTSRMFSA
jgi:hypothetical protein